MGNEIVITVEGLLWFAAAIVTLGGAAAVLSKWVAPARKLRKDVDGKVDRADFLALKERMDKLESYQDIDHKKLQKIETGNEQICWCLMALMDHELDGNSVDRLRKAKHDMEKYLIQK